MQQVADAETDGGQLDAFGERISIVPIFDCDGEHGGEGERGPLGWSVEQEEQR
jgi:hypothetical protein